MSQVVLASELTTIERIALATAYLLQSGTVTPHEVARVAECKIRHAYKILSAISRVLPVTNENGKWFIVG